MKSLQQLFDNNRAWAEATEAAESGFFQRLSRQQAPDYLWIGCSDSRVPANEIVGLLPGELFVHRNVANVVAHSDLNCLSVLQYAVEVLQVEHVIVCGHYGCGGVKAAMSNHKHGLIDNWLHSIKDTYFHHEALFQPLGSETERVNLLCELNVKQQVRSVCHTTIVQDAWQRGQALAVHGWIYSIEDGLLKDLDVTVDNPDAIEPVYRISDGD
jgi:carbonic anhydrase